MNAVINLVKNEPVRVYEFLVALFAALVIIFPGLPVAALLGVAAVLLGIGERSVRANVTPSDRVYIDVRELDAMGRLPIPGLDEEY